MATLTTTRRGQVTFRKELLKHLGIQAGEKIELEKLPDGRLSLSAVPPKGTWDDVYGCLAGKTTKVATLEEINQAIEDGWAGKL